MITTLAYTLPESSIWLFRASFWGILGLLTAGGIGLYRASKTECILHRNTKDAFIALLVAMLHWSSLVLLVQIGMRDTDLLRYMKTEAVQLATVWLGTFAITLVQVRRLNDSSISIATLFFATAARLISGLLTLLLTLLLPIAFFLTLILSRFYMGSLWGVLGGFRELIDTKIFILSLPVQLLRGMWQLIHLTSTEGTDNRWEWVYIATSVVLFLFCGWWLHKISTDYAPAKHDDLLLAVQKSSPAAVRRIIAFNPNLYRNDAVETAVDKSHRGTLRAIIRTPYDLSTAQQHATKTDNQKMLKFLNK